MFCKKMVYAALSALVFGNVVSLNLLDRDDRDGFVAACRERISHITRSDHPLTVPELRDLTMVLCDTLPRVAGFTLVAPRREQKRRIYDLCCWFADNWQIVSELLVFMEGEFEVKPDEIKPRRNWRLEP
jgi:hypothetical protein